MKQIFLICILFIFACSEPIELSRVSLGKIIDANVIPTSFNESMKTQIKTKKGFYVIRGISSIPFGVELFIVTYDNGRTKITWKGNKNGNIENY